MRGTNDRLLQKGKELLLGSGEVNAPSLPCPPPLKPTLPHPMSTTPTILSSPAFPVCCRSFHQLVAGLPTFLPRNSFALALWKPTQSSYLPKETFQKTTHWIFYGVCVCFSFRRWAGRKVKIALCTQGQYAAKLRSPFSLFSTLPHLLPSLLPPSYNFLVLFG